MIHTTYAHNCAYRARRWSLDSRSSSVRPEEKSGRSGLARHICACSDPHTTSHFDSLTTLLSAALSPLSRLSHTCVCARRRRLLGISSARMKRIGHLQVHTAHFHSLSQISRHPHNGRDCIIIRVRAASHGVRGPRGYGAAIGARGGSGCSRLPVFAVRDNPGQDRPLPE